MRLDKALTLLELIVAVSVAVAVALVTYNFFNVEERTAGVVRETGKLKTLVTTLYFAFLRDVESADLRYGKISVIKREEGDSIEFYTKNCFFYRDLCKVEYRTFKGFLVRTEFRLNDITRKGIEVPVAFPVDSLHIFVSAGDRWKEGHGNLKPRLLKIVAVTVDSKEIPMVFKIRSGTYR